MKKVLVTGAAGFIGSHLTTQLVEQGYEVIAFDNLCTGNLHNLKHIREPYRFVLGDVKDADALMSALEGVQVVFHQAAIASVPRSVSFPLESHQACATSTLNLLDCCVKAGVKRVVYAGSSSAYGDNENPALTEQELPSVHSPYAAAKLSGELYCQAFANCYDLEVVRLRYFNIFGPRQDPNSPYSAVIPIFVSLLLRGERPTIFGNGQQTRDFTFVNNVVQANILAAKTPGVSGRVYNVATGQSISVLEMLESICEILEIPCDPYFADPRLGDVLHSGADISRIQEELEFEEEVPFLDGLEQTVHYYREQFESTKLRESSVASLN
ncbi:MAG: NAD-dependent epimerase/dehydratase family protein [Planctomycetaceae bacterium]|nr:NAD-dependent epimerase/dehydratase family protein [Planctomycetaceae bacterium]